MSRPHHMLDMIDCILPARDAPVRDLVVVREPDPAPILPPEAYEPTAVKTPPKPRGLQVTRLDVYVLLDSMPGASVHDLWLRLRARGIVSTERRVAGHVKQLVAEGKARECPQGRRDIGRSGARVVYEVAT